MAILEALPGLEICVLVDNEPLREYHDDDAHEAAEDAPIKSISKYVEAVSGKEFVVRVSIDHSFHLDCPAIAFHTLIDGNTVRKSTFSSATFPQSIQRGRITSKVTREIDGSFFSMAGDDSMHLLKKFKFIEIETNDSMVSDIREHSKQMKQAGEIVINVFRAGAPIRKVGQGKPLGDRLQMGKAEVHEKALKGEAKSHTTSFGNTTQPLAKKNYDIELLNGEAHPMVSFKFKYRSRNALKSLLVLPRTPSPEPELPPRASLESDLDLNDPPMADDYQEFLEWKKRRNGLRPNKEAGDDMSRVKTEPGVKQEPARSMPGQSQTIVDLSDEDPLNEHGRATRAANLSPRVVSTIKREGSPIDSGSPKKRRTG